MPLSQCIRNLSSNIVEQMEITWMARPLLVRGRPLYAMKLYEAAGVVFLASIIFGAPKVRQKNGKLPKVV